MHREPDADQLLALWRPAHGAHRCGVPAGNLSTAGQANHLPRVWPRSDVRGAFARASEAARVTGAGADLSPRLLGGLSQAFPPREESEASDSDRATQSSPRGSERRPSVASVACGSRLLRWIWKAQRRPVCRQSRKPGCCTPAARAALNGTEGNSGSCLASFQNGRASASPAHDNGCLCVGPHPPVDSFHALPAVSRDQPTPAFFYGNQKFRMLHHHTL